MADETPYTRKDAYEAGLYNAPPLGSYESPFGDSEGAVGGPTKRPLSYEEWLAEQAKTQKGGAAPQWLNKEMEQYYTPEYNKPPLQIASNASGSTAEFPQTQYTQIVQSTGQRLPLGTNPNGMPLQQTASPASPPVQGIPNVDADEYARTRMQPAWSAQPEVPTREAPDPTQGIDFQSTARGFASGYGNALGSALMSQQDYTTAQGASGPYESEEYRKFKQEMGMPSKNSAEDGEKNSLGAIGSLIGKIAKSRAGG